MAEQNKISTISIILLIVGLVIGGAGSYMYVSGKMNPVLDELTAESESLTIDLQAASTDASELETLLSELEETLSEAEDELLQLSREKTRTESDISSAEHTIANNLEKIEVLNLQASPSEGREIFSAYGYSFQYPIGMSFMFEEIQEKEVSEQYGYLDGSIDTPGKTETFGLTWQHLDFVPDVEADLEDLIDNYLEQMSEYTEITVIKGEKQDSMILDHVVYYQNVILSDESDFSVEVFYATWYCNLDSRAYRLFFYDEDMSSDLNFESYLETVLCHR